MTIRYTPFKSWHLKLFEEGDHYDNGGMSKELAALTYRHVTGYTMLINGEIAGILGIVPMWDGVAEVTCVPGQLFYENLRPCLKGTKALIELAIETYNLHRVQASCLSSRPKHGRFLKYFGFEFEGILRKYGTTGKDYDMYALVVEGN